MQFIKYPSLTNHYTARRQKFINFDDDYVSTEKIHGSNVSIIVDNENNIEIAKRTALLTEEERTQKPWNTLAQFATEQKELIVSWSNSVRNLANEYVCGTIKQINFYGELYGDIYDESYCSSVQKCHTKLPLTTRDKYVSLTSMSSSKMGNVYPYHKTR